MNYEEYADLVVQTVRNNLPPGRSSLTAAALGMHLSRTDPDCQWKTFGARTLAEFLRQPRLQQSLELTQTEKSALAVAVRDWAEVSRPVPVQAYNPLRKTVWEAFVLPSPVGRRFLNRHSGMARFGLQVAPAPADDWVEIEPISVDQQRSVAEEFLTESRTQRTLAMVEAMTSVPWSPHAFFAALQEHDPSLARRWNRHRSSYVSSTVEKWLTAHALPFELAFQVSASPIRALAGGLDSNALNDEVKRQVILEALSTLSLDRLLEIPLPASHVFAALQKAHRR
jgi:hypothetical protein